MANLYFKTEHYTHAVGEVEFSQQRQAVRAQNSSLIIGARYIWTLTGKLLTSDPASAVAALEAAYALPITDAGLWDQDSGSAIFRLQASQLVGGIQVVDGPNFPPEPGHLINHVPYSLTLEGQTAYDSGTPFGSGVLDFEETVSIIGGGPRFIVQETMLGPPVKQYTNQQTPTRMTQVGRALGKDYWPTPPAARWPDHEHKDRHQVNYTTPQQPGAGGSQATGYMTTWAYEFTAAQPQSGFPTTF